jgi:ubiquinone/menaquinone biosynthesis C-methylase UbiE
MDHLQRVRQEFTQQAASFAASASLTDQAQVARLVDAVVHALGDAGRGRVLDVACGPGIVTAALAAVAAEAVGLDLTPEMLVKARERCAKAGRTNVAFHEGSATALPFGDASFDAAVTRLSFHHFLAPRDVLAEMLRVVKPGGVVAVADVVGAEAPDKAAVQNAIEILRDPSHVRMLPASELLTMFADTGAAIVRQDSWDKPRELEEWFGIVADPQRVAPLRIVVHALAQAGEDAGMDLAIRDGAVRFVHRWLLIVARKP